MNKYCAFLRGINVGGNRTIKMQELKEILQSIPLHNIQTVLASGNVYFETEEKNISTIQRKIKSALNVEALIITQGEMETLIQKKPFEKISKTEKKTLVTFFGEENSDFTLHQQEDFETLLVTQNVVCVAISKEMGTTEAMKILEMRYGKHITTRNWNTVEKLALLFKPLVHQA